MTTADTRGELMALLGRAIAMTDDRITRAARVGGDPVLATIRAQLLAVQSDINRESAPTPELAAKVNFGWIAARQYEDGSDPEYKDVLTTIFYLYRQRLATTTPPA